MKFLTAIVVLALSILLSQSGIAADKSIEATRKAAEQGDAVAQFDLGWAYERGKGVPRDLNEAVRLYRLAAEQGSAEAQVNLGVLYAEGSPTCGLPRTAKLRGAAAAARDRHCPHLVPQDNREAVRLYRLAAEQGNASGQNNLGNAYERGAGVPQDEKEAARWYVKAAKQGHALARRNLENLQKIKCYGTYRFRQDNCRNEPTTSCVPGPGFPSCTYTYW